MKWKQSSSLGCIEVIMVLLVSLSFMVSTYSLASYRGETTNQITPVYPQESMLCKCAIVLNTAKSIMSQELMVDHIFCSIKGTIAVIVFLDSKLMFKAASFLEGSEVDSAANELCLALVQHVEDSKQRWK